MTTPSTIARLICCVFTLVSIGCIIGCARAARTSKQAASDYNPIAERNTGDTVAQALLV